MSVAGVFTITVSFFAYMQMLHEISTVTRSRRCTELQNPSMNSIEKKAVAKITGYILIHILKHVSP